MNNKPKFSNEAGASGVNFTQPSRSDNTSRRCLAGIGFLQLVDALADAVLIHRGSACAC